MIYNVIKHTSIVSRWDGSLRIFKLKTSDEQKADEFWGSINKKKKKQNNWNMLQTFSMVMIEMIDENYKGIMYLQSFFLVLL